METVNPEVTGSIAKAESLRRELDGMLERINKGGADLGDLYRDIGALSQRYTATVQLARQQADAVADPKVRALAQRKAHRIEQDHALVRGDVEKHIGKFYKAQKEAEDRKRLFGADSSKRGSGRDDGVQSALRENKNLRGADSELDRMIGQGRAVLGNLVDQNKILKKARTTLLDAASTIGMSRSVIGTIERRSKEDSMLVYGGMLLTVFLLGSLWWLLKM